ncbi:MAG: 3-hydroxyacyl-CoA dehydrogenase NAD-binding domain-containing protein [Planctomycetota bacterium]
MIDLAGIPLPADAPPPGTCWRIERPAPELVRLHLDPPHRPKLAVFDVPVLRDLDLALAALAADPALRGLVIAGREPLSFAGGADIETIARFAEKEHAEKFVREGQALFERLHRLGREGGGRLCTVAAVGGAVPGGACEIALACDRLVLADDPKTRIGLPEVLLGIFPAWGGSQRLPRRIGVPAALDSILAGKLHPAKRALRLGLADRLAKPAYLWRVAEEIARGGIACPRRERRGWRLWLVDRNPLAGAAIAHLARRGVMKETKGQYPAPLAVLPLVVRAPRMRLATGLAAELAAVGPLAASDVSKSLVNLFLLSEAAKKLGVGPDGEKAPRIARAAVIGAGVMGGGIASLLAEKGVEARLHDLEPAALDAAVHAHRREIERKRKRRRIERPEADAALDRLEVTRAPVGFARCELVLEAVAERLEVKRAVLGRLATLARPDAILATNTSSLAVDAIAASLPRPERVVGMHFFNPVRRMPLVEIVRGTATDPGVIARVARLAVDLGKTPVVVKDVPGFLVNRLLGPYLDEALRLVEMGADPAAIDRALVDFGMPMGPCELVDEVGLDIAAHAGASLAAAYGGRMAATGFLGPLLAAGHLGKKSGAGIYLWKPGPAGRPANGGVNPALPSRRGPFTLTMVEVLDRLVLAMGNEAARCLEDAVVAGPRELDLATVFGTGFAPFRGGLLRHADAVGLAEIVERLERLHAAPDVAGSERAERFAPAASLVERARAGRSFHG